MGTDIHPAIEVHEYPETRWWTLVAVPPDDRNYEFFALLAGVRGEPEAWIPPRGFPLGAHCGVVDGDHTASWFTLAEARTFVLPDDVGENTRQLWTRWLRYMEFVAQDYDVPPESVRAVFNFDS